MQRRIRERVDSNKSGLYRALLFPMMFTFMLTFTISRAISYLAPGLYLEVGPGLHIHHFTYGIFILAFAGYLALIHDSPRAKFWIALLFGIGLGFAFDEFGMWLRLRDDEIVRWEYDGFNIIVGFVIFMLVFKPGVKLVPLRIVKVGQTEQTILVVQDGLVVEKPVTLGQVFGDLVEVTSGIEPGDELIIENGSFLDTGDPVEIRN